MTRILFRVPNGRNTCFQKPARGHLTLMFTHWKQLIAAKSG